jgi:hypothetical protein
MVFEVTKAAIALIVAMFGMAPAKPPGPPPHVSGATTAPPPAWYAAGGRDGWLAYGSYCWSSAGAANCVDFIPPAKRPGLPLVRVPRGSLIALHIRFVPESLHGTLLLPNGRARTTALRPARNVSWRVSGFGILSVEAKGAGGSASYLVRVAARTG